MKKGFTLIELLVVISIIGLLAAAGLSVYTSAQKKGREAKVKADFLDIRNALAQLELDTGQLPGHLNPEPCSQNLETSLDSCAGGLVCTDGNFPKWNGPYLLNAGIDPWGHNYWFDPDYTCTTGTVGCEKFTNGYTTRAVVSFGPNGNGLNIYEADNIVMILCSP